MKDISTKLNLLLFSLEKKWEKLCEIKIHTESQRQMIVKSEQSFLELYRKKQNLMEEIDRLNQGFSSVSKELMPVLQEHSEKYKEQIKQMQGHIEKIGQIEAEILDLEKKNFVEYRLKYQKKDEISGGRLPREEVSKKYKQMNQ